MSPCQTLAEAVGLQFRSGPGAAALTQVPPTAPPQPRPLHTAPGCQSHLLLKLGSLFKKLPLSPPGLPCCH